MSKKVPIFNGFEVILNGETFKADKLNQVFAMIGLDSDLEECRKMRTDITRILYCFGTIDLSEYCEGDTTLVINAL